MTLAIENCLISDIPNILTPDAFIDISDPVLRSLGAESELITKQRGETQMRLEALEHSLTVCQEHCKEYPEESTPELSMSRFLHSTFVPAGTRTNTTPSQNRRRGFWVFPPPCLPPKLSTKQRTSAPFRSFQADFPLLRLSHRLMHLARLPGAL